MSAQQPEPAKVSVAEPETATAEDKKDYQKQLDAEEEKFNLLVRRMQAAKKFLAFLGSKEAQTYFAKNLQRLPTNGDVDPSIFTPATQKGIDIIKKADYIAQFYDRDTTPEMAEKGMAAFQDFMANPGNAQQILTGLETERARIFSGTPTP